MRWEERSYLSRSSLADEAGRLALGRSIELQTKALDMRVGGGAVIPLISLHLTDLDHRDARGIRSWQFGRGWRRCGNGFGRAIPRTVDLEVDTRECCVSFNFGVFCGMVELGKVWSCCSP